jgi:cobalt-zinc-cadmium efflux system outer membrane protein
MTTSLLRFFVLLGFLASGCTKVPYQDDGEVSARVASLICSEVTWRQGSLEDEALIESIAARELSLGSVTELALLNNPQIQEVFEDLGIAQADVLEAGLISNPAFSLEVRYPNARGLHTNIEYLVTASLLDAFLIPIRKKVAAAEFEQTKLKVSKAILDIAFDVQETFYKLVQEKKKQKIATSLSDLISITRDLFGKQLAAGNIYRLDHELAKISAFESQILALESDAEVKRLQEKLNQLLGFRSEKCLILPDQIHEETFKFDLCTLEATALNERLDLEVARIEIRRLEEMLGLKAGWTYTNFALGLAGERDPDGKNLIGPGFSGELPIFNYGQADRMRLFAKLRQAKAHLEALEIEVLSALRSAHLQTQIYKQVIDDYKNNVLPTYKEIAISSEALYNSMGLGVDRLLENKRQELIANQNYMESIKKILRR